MTRNWTFRLVDLETTGFQEGAEVIEMATQECVFREGRLERRGRPDSWLFNAERGIPPEARSVHHISPAEIQGKPLFVEAGEAAWAMRPYLPGLFELDPIDALIAHNAEHEQKHLKEIAGDAPWICTLKCAMHAWPEAPNHKNWTLAYWLESKIVGSRTQKAEPHRAAGDLWATARVLECLLAEHPVETLLEWSAAPKPCLTVPVGEQRGKPWSAIDLGLLEWFLKPGKNFDQSTIAAARAELDRRVAESQTQGQLFGGKQ